MPEGGDFSTAEGTAASIRQGLEGRDVQLLFRVGYDIANADKFPELKPGNEFKPKRDALMRK